jgi:uncharacterized protein (DUF1778 family)
MAAQKNSRLDLRLTDNQRSDIECAADLAGSTLTGWAASTLAEAARQQIAAAQTSYLPDSAWEEFLVMLDEPMDERAKELLSRRPVWERR